MRIGILWHVQYPWDVRLEKFIKTLNSNNHTIFLVTSIGKHKNIRENHDDLNIYRISSNYKSKLVRKIIQAPLFFNPVWISRSFKYFKENQIDILVVRDLPLGGLARYLGNKLNIPVFFDMAENYPAALVAYNKAIYKPFLFNNAWLPKLYEYMVLKSMNTIFVVAEEQKNRLVAEGINKEKIRLVKNTPTMEFVSQITDVECCNGGEIEKEKLLYIGKIDRHRGVETLIRSVDLLKDEIEMELTLVGDGNEVSRLKQLTEQLEISGIVKFSGWIDHQEIGAYINKSTLCVIPHLKSEHTDTTIPNKIYDYMAYGKPVIVSSCNPLVRMIEDENIGVWFESENPDQLAKSIMKIHKNKNRKQLCENGIKAVRDKYNWSVDSAVLGNSISSVGNK